MSKIEWTEKTWNPIVGCSAASPGCDNCYAAGVASRGLSDAHRGLAVRGEWTGEIRLFPERLDAPMAWKKPQRVFVCSMSDLFHPDVPGSFIESVFDTMLQTDHTYQVLTKRPQRMASWVTEFLSPALTTKVLENIWLGTSIESDRYTWRVDHLRDTPAEVRFLSLEPLIGPLPSLDLTGIDWVIVGGESGPHSRPIDPGWVRDIRDHCIDLGVAFFFKQWGGRSPKVNGRELDGRTWSDYPQAEVSAL